MSADFFVRLVGMVIFAILGGYLGYDLGTITDSQLYYAAVVSLVGALAGLVLTPMLTTRPVRTLRSLLGRLAAETLFAGILGMITGLLVAALLSFPLSLLPEPFGSIMPFVGVLLFVYFASR